MKSIRDNRYRQLLFLFLFIGLSANAQTSFTIRGMVSDSSTRLPLPAMSVVLLDIEADTSVVAFTATNEEGSFLLRIQPTRHRLLVSIRGIGYAERTLNLLTNQSQDIGNMNLMAKAIALREVAVKGAVPIKVDKDTTTYNVTSFANGSEQSVEELLKKLPGFQVSEDGKIRVNGKVIQKVLIEGEDFFSRKYQLITRNMGPDALDKVQTIDNYSDNALLHDLEKTGDLVVNLTIKKDRRIKPFGSVGAGGGVGSRYELNAAIFSLVKKLKTGVVLNTNNTGYDPVVNAHYELETDTKDARLAPTQVELRPLIYTQLPVLSFVDAIRYNFNQARLGGLNANYKVSDRLSVKAHGYYSWDNQQYTTSSQLQFVADSLVISVRDSANYRRTPRLWASHVQVEYKPDVKTILRFIVDTKQSQSLLASRSISRNSLLTEPVVVDGQEKVILNNQAMQVTRRLQGRNALILNITHQSASLPLHQVFQSQRYALFFNRPGSFSQYAQQMSFRSDEISGFAQWKAATLNSNLAVGIGFTSNRDVLQTTGQLQTPNKILDSLMRPYANNIQYDRQAFTAEIRYTINWNNWRVNATGSLSPTQTTYTNYFIDTAYTQRPMLSNVSMSISRQGQKGHRLGLLSSFSESLPTINNLFSGYLLTDYRTFSQASPIFRVASARRLILTYSYANLPALFLFRSQASIASTSPAYVSSVYLTNTLTQQATIPLDGAVQQQFISWEIDKLIAPISTKIRWEFFGSRATQLNRVNTNELRTNQFQTITNSLYAITAFDGPLNIELGMHWEYSTVKTSKLDMSGFQTVLFKPKAQLFYRPSKDWYIKLIGERFDWRTGGARSITHFLDASIHYAPNHSAWSFDLAGRNLLDNQQINITQLSNFLISQQLYRVLPMYSLLKVTKRI